MQHKVPLFKGKRGSRQRCSLLLLALLGIAPFTGSAALPESASVAALQQARPVRAITGQVKDKSGAPLPGVSIAIKGTTQGAVTDAEGRFSLEAGPQDVLVFSFIGFNIQEVTVGNQANLSVVLQEDAKALEEVVVVGYGTQKKANLTGAVSQVTSKTLENRPITNLNNGLQGLMPGVTITNAHGLPGNNAGAIRIRGIGTLGNANPLVVVDGIPGGNLSLLNPNDIETISVLKDAASASIFGVRGANGVIMVTTKKGASAKPAIDISSYFGMTTPTALPKLLGSPEYMEMLNEAQINVGRNPTYTDDQIKIAREGSDPNYYANTNWIDAVLKKRAPQQNHNVSVSGGAKEFNYYLSYGLLKEGGLVTGDNFSHKRNNVRARLSTTVMDRIQVDANVGYIDRNYTGSAEGVGSGTGPLYAATQIVPLVPVRFTTGGWAYLGGQRNPVAVTTDGGTEDFSSQEFTGNLSGTLSLFDGFKLKGQYGLVRSNSKRDIFSKTINYYSPIDNSLLYQTNPQNKIDSRDYTNLYQTLIGTAEYEKRFAENHDLKLLIGASQEENLGDNFVATRTNLPSQEIGHIALGTQNQLNSGDASQWALRSGFGRLNYGFANKYLLEANFRYDGSTRFARDVRWNMFTSASLGWNFSEENFFSGIKNVVEFGKLRVSYGTIGNDQVGEFPYMDILGPVGTMPIGNINTIGFRQVSVGNQILTWESQLKQNAGLDLAFLRNRLSFSADYFINRTNDILLTLPLPDVFGADYPAQNAGKVENKGWELQAGWNDQVGEVQYGANFNLFDVHNKVVDLGGTPPTYGDRIRMVGQPIDAFYGLVAERISQVEDYDYDDATKKYTPKFPFIAGDPLKPGDLIYRDLDGDGKVSLDKDRKVIGNAIPRFTFGFRGNVAWKGADLSFFLQGVGKADNYLFGAARHAYINEGSLPQEIHRDRWTPENTDASYPRFTYQQSHNQRLSTFWMEDASYLRLKNLQVGYTLPAAISQKARISRLRIYASAENLLTKTDFYYAFDPESASTSGGFYPQVKTYTMGLNINLK
ncbi:MAG: SusC/RagA family TonB-linked outer membrane protein [Adhaeribacter sp.]